MKKFDIYIDPPSEQLQLRLVGIIRKQGGQIIGVGLTPQGVNIFGWAPQSAIDALKEVEKLGFKLETPQ
jgi:hypothetical protein